MDTALAETTTAVTHADLANAIRFLAADAVEAAKSGHPGMPMGMADVATVLFQHALKFDAAAPDWADRDRFVLSAGHGSMLIYALLHLTGYDLSIDDLKAFRQWGAKTPGHPEYGHTEGVEVTTGPLGQGISTAVGMALAERLMAARYRDLVDHRTWVIAGDGDLMEGISHEAISMAGRWALNKLCVLWDDNEICIDGAVCIAETGDQLKRFEAAGWATKRIDGHDVAAITAALDWAKAQTKPTLIACRTKIGKGAPTLEGSHDTHGKALGATEIAAMRQALGWSHAPFVIPSAIKAAWEAIGSKGAKAHAAWGQTLAQHPQRTDFERAMAGDLPDDAFKALEAHIAACLESKPKDATRVHSGSALEHLTPTIIDMVGGSADLTGSNNTYVKGMKAVDAPDYAGRYIHYGVREHGMAAAMNGMALHGGIIPYSGTFLVFSDYSRPAIRLAALMGIRVIHVLTHDSIGLGEDGPTHQPVEHLAALRAIPNLNVFRPADAIEAAECWQVALSSKTTPSAMALSRQKVPAVRLSASSENLSAKGAYELSPASGAAKATIFATGTEVSIAIEAQKTLEAAGIPTRVVSVPCFERFAAQDAAYQHATIGDAPVKVAVEAAIGMGWERFIGTDGAFVGMTGFGASAPAERLYAEFGITADAVVAAVKAKV
jgi:transketolase